MLWLGVVLCGIWYYGTAVYCGIVVLWYVIVNYCRYFESGSLRGFMNPLGEEELCRSLEIPASELYTYAVHTDADLDLCRQTEEERKKEKKGTGRNAQARKRRKASLF